MALDGLSHLLVLKVALRHLLVILKKNLVVRVGRQLIKGYLASTKRLASIVGLFKVKHALLLILVASEKSEFFRQKEAKLRKLDLVEYLLL